MTPPTVADFKTYFSRDFPYGTATNQVMDADITRALADAAVQFNNCLFDGAAYTAAYLYLAAHYLVLNLRASTAGLAGSFSWLSNSRSVGSVSESFAIPESISSNPILALLAKTNYGVRYLQMVLPMLTGQIFTVCGGTNP